MAPEMDGKRQSELEEEKEGVEEEKEGEQEEGKIFFDDSSLGVESQQTKEAEEVSLQHGGGPYRKELHEREVDEQNAGAQNNTAESFLGTRSQQVGTNATDMHMPQSTQQSTDMWDNSPKAIEESLSLPSDAIEGMEDAYSMMDVSSISHDGADEGRKPEGLGTMERELQGKEREELLEEVVEEGGIGEDMGDEEAETEWDKERMAETAETMDPEALDAVGELVEEEGEGVDKSAGIEGAEVFAMAGAEQGEAPNEDSEGVGMAEMLDPEANAAVELAHKEGEEGSKEVTMTGAEEGEAPDKDNEDVGMAGTAKGEKEGKEKQEQGEEDEESYFDDSSLGIETQRTKEADGAEEQHLEEGEEHVTEEAGLAAGMVAETEEGAGTEERTETADAGRAEKCAHQEDQTLKLDTLKARCVLAFLPFCIFKLETIL
jgi:hypothetical protein